MKRLLVVLLSLGLITAFAATASAADVKFGGGYYVVGVYENNPSLSTSGYSHAFFYQRVRFQPVFSITEGLTFTARMDALEKQWGNTNWKGGTDDLTSSRRNQGLASTAAIAAVPAGGGAQAAYNAAVTNKTGQKIQENFEFERAYVTFATKLGLFQIGYQNVDNWGTDFGDYSYTRPKAAYSGKFGPMLLSFIYEKLYEADTSLDNPNKVDADKDTYALTGIYKGKGIETGLMLKYYAYNNKRTATVGYSQKYNQLSPYVKATVGPLYIEGEATYWFGKYAEYETAGNQDVDIDAQSFYLKGRYNIGPAYVGAQFAYASGDNLSDKTKYKTAPTGGGAVAWNPALILMNDWLNTWTEGGSTASSPDAGATTAVSNKKLNTLIYNAFVGFNPTPKLNVEAVVTYATVDKKALTRSAAGVVTEAVSDKLGTEFDVKATYKIYDNLSYMVGAGYLWTGDYFKGSKDSDEIDNNYILLNQLTLNF
jgi:hypothetical protein